MIGVLVAATAAVCLGVVGWAAYCLSKRLDEAMRTIGR